MTYIIDQYFGRCLCPNSEPYPGEEHPRITGANLASIVGALLTIATSNTGHPIATSVVTSFSLVNMIVTGVYRNCRNIPSNSVEKPSAATGVEQLTNLHNY